MAPAMEGFGTFKAMLEQYEQAGKEMLDQYERAEKGKEKLQQTNIELQRTTEELQGKVKQLQSEIGALRRTIEYGPHMASKNRRRDEAMQEAFASALAQAPNDLKASPVPESEISFTDDRQLVSHKHADIKCAAEEKSTEGEDVATSGALAELPYNVGMVEHVAEDGSLTYCESRDLPPLVQASTIKNMQDAKEWMPPKTKLWERLFTSDSLCATAAYFGESTHWIDGLVGKFACRLCFVQKRACVLLDPAAQTLAVLPLPPSMRAKAAVAGTDGYYITSRHTSRNGAAKDGPWSKEPTISAMARKKRRRTD